jgi:hypothetical protein
MKRSLLGLAAATALLSGGLLPGIPSVSAGDRWAHAARAVESRASSPPKRFCVDSEDQGGSSTGTYGCFQKRGDKMLVFDAEPDGYSAAVVWKTDYGRSGICVNSRGAGKLEVCNYEPIEDTEITFWVVDYDVPERVYRDWPNERTVYTGRIRIGAAAATSGSCSVRRAMCRRRSNGQQPSCPTPSRRSE